MTDAELLLRRARRPLVIGIGGGGDVVGALATAEFSRLYDDADPVLGGVSWERRPIDPVPGPRMSEEIEGAQTIAPAVMLAGPDTQVRGRGLRFAESHMAAYLKTNTVLIDVNPGPRVIADGLAVACAELGCDLTVFVDVGGDVLAQGHERGLSSPLCDAVMLAAAARLGASGMPVLAGVFGIGCDAELKPDEVLALIAEVARGGGYAGARGLTDAVAAHLEGAIEFVPTEASAQAVRAFRGASGLQSIRNGRRTFELSPTAAITFLLDVAVTYGSVARLARAVADAADLSEANAVLGGLGVRTELDGEVEFAESSGSD